MLAWHLVTKDQDYAFARPALVADKRRKLELAAGAPSRRGNYGLPRAAYNDKQRRNEEKLAVEQAEHAYEVLVAHWQPKRANTGVTIAVCGRDKMGGGGRGRQQRDATFKP